MKFKITKLLFFIPVLIQTSPVSVTSGGTGLTTLTAAGGLPYGSNTTAMAVLAIGSANQVLTVTDGLIPSWNNFFPGYTAGTFFAYGGTNSTLANSPNDTIIISTTIPGSILSTATDGTAVGYNAALGITSATDAVAIGSGAFQSLTTGINNTAFGYQASNKSSTGTQIVAFGYQAGFNLLTGTLSGTACGYQALFTNTNGGQNVACGVNALYSLTGSSSVRNIGFGYYAGQHAASGSDMTAFGYQALYNAAPPNQITGIGANAVYNTTTAGNVGVGSSALYTNAGGTPNVAVGYKAMYTNLSGGSNIAIGYQALYTNSTTSQSTAFGSLALQNSTTANNTAFGYNALNAVTGSGTQMTALGSGAGSTATTGSNNLYIGYNAAPISNIESNNTVIGNSSTATAYMFGIYNVSPSTTLNVVVNSSGQLGAPVSSKRFKENIVEVTQQELDKLLALNVVKFNYIDDETQEVYYGLIAEEVDKIMPEIVVKDKNHQAETVQYFKLIPLLVQAAQEKNNKIQSLTNQVDVLQESIQKLLVQYVALKNTKK